MRFVLKSECLKVVAIRKCSLEENYWDFETSKLLTHKYSHPILRGSCHHSILKRVRNFTSKQFFWDFDTFPRRNCKSSALWRQSGDFILAAEFYWTWRSVFSLIVPSCDNERGEGLTLRLRLLDATHEARARGKWSPRHKTRSSRHKMVQRSPEPETNDGESGMKVIPEVLNIISLITLSCLNIRNLISNFRQLG